MGGRGLHSVYAGCCCEDCVARRSTPLKRLNRGALHTKGDRAGYLQVECWCQHTTVKVRASDVRKGLTGSCKNYWCRPPE